VSQVPSRHGLLDSLSLFVAEVSCRMKTVTPQRFRNVEGMEYGWAYKPEPLALSCYTRYWRRATAARRAPLHCVVKPVTLQPRWIIYFIYAPTGRLETHHHFTLRRLKAHGIPLLVVFASPSPADMPPILEIHADAIYWKALSGYDFSAYSIALRGIARQSPGSRVLVMNDSVFGPFADLTPSIDAAPWDLTGFTATDVSKQRHIQSYAFVLKNVTEDRLDDLRWVFPSQLAFSTAYGAISCQELWFARVASRSMSVGSFWWGEAAKVHDPSLTKAVELIDVGFPFLKRSLLTRQSRFHEPGVIGTLVERLEAEWSPPEN
jgi:hypothetical protein